MVVPLAVAFLGAGLPFIGIGFPRLALNAATPTARPAAAFAAAAGILSTNPGGDRCPYSAARPPFAAPHSRYAAAFSPDPGRPPYAGRANLCAAGRGYLPTNPANPYGNPGGYPAANAATCNADPAGRRAVPNAAGPAYAPTRCSHRSPYSGSASHAHAYTATYRRHCPAPRVQYRCRWPPVSAAYLGAIRRKQPGGRRAGLSGL